MNFNILQEFRQGLYAALGKSKDALFELTDALLSESQARCLPELSFSPFFTRQWPSLYQALQEGQLDRGELRHLMAHFAPEGLPGQRLLIGVDASNIPRPESVTAADRTCLHVHNLPEGEGAITYGWQFSTCVVLPYHPGAETYILDNTRIQSSQTPCQVAAVQLAQLQPLLSDEALLMADRYFGSATFVKLSQKTGLDKLLRIKSNLVFYRKVAVALPDSKKGRGAPRKDGSIFKCKDTLSQGTPDESWSGIDAKGQPIKVERWNELHFRKVREVELSVLRVSREGASGKKRDPRISWFIFVGQKPLALSEVAECYQRRYSQEHGFRFDKQALLWEKPRLRTPGQFELWTDLLSVVHNEIVLARPLVEETAIRRPWENAHGKVSLAQVRRSLSGIISSLGTPARLPKLRGKSPGRAKGAQIKPAKRYEVVRKKTTHRKKVKKRA
jgi:hypothetical protein